MGTERDEDFEDLIGSDGSDSADEAADEGKTPEAQDEGNEGQDDPDASKDGAGDDDGGDADGDQGDKKKAKAPGKDASKDDAGDDDGDDADADKDASKKEPMVPKKALDSVKRRNRELSQRLKKIEQRFETQDAEAARKAMPDPQTHPVEHARWVQRQTVLQNISDRLNYSEYHARKRYGDDIVTDAFNWANEQMEGPNGEQFAKDLFAHADPYDYAVELHKQAQEAGNGGGAGEGDEDPEYEEFKAWKAARQKGTEPAANAAERKQSAPQRRPQSLAERPSAAGPKGEEIVQDPFSAEFGS